MSPTPLDLLLPALWGFKSNGTRFIFDHHDLSPELYVTRFGRRGLAHAGLRIAERLSFALADVVISTNESYKRLAVSRGRKKPEDVFVVRNGPHAAPLASSEPDPSLKRGRPYLLTYVGMIEPQDGVDLAIRALSVLRGRRDDWHALFVGDGDAFEDVKALAAELGLEDCIEFTGFIWDRAQLERILSSSDICLSPEPKNPLNDASTLIKVAEYMALGCPVVAFDLAETRVTARGGAAYAAPNDVESFADQIDRLLDDPQRRARDDCVRRGACPVRALVGALEAGAPVRLPARADEGEQIQCHGQFRRGVETC